MKEAREITTDKVQHSDVPMMLRWQQHDHDLAQGLIILPSFKGSEQGRAEPAGRGRRKPADRVFLPIRSFSTPHLMIKRFMDFWVTLLALIALIPLFAVIAISLRLSGSPVVFRQKRVGRGGQLFDCYKFCTMKQDAEAELRRILAESPEQRLEWFKTQKLTNDPRVTRLGRFLRTASLDELPQFINVLRGEMSLIGPRPILPNELAKYGPFADHYLSVKPGLTGLWQISGRNATTYNRRVALDVAYARNASLGFDCYILLHSTVPILTGKGAR
jgi:lipopolysaccharide/colanic/teichoic acid biosynthesis glycosyltransferase